MKHLFTVCIIVLWAYAYPSISRMLDESSIVKAHQQWMIKYGRTYTNDFETEKRFKIFKDNFEYIEKFNNAGNNSYTLGLNPYSDLTTEEFLASHTGFKVSSSKARSNPVLFNFSITDDDLPTNFDWREKGAVTDVKNQGDCDGCWAFAAVAAVEGFWKIKMGTLLTLSEQQLIDCDGNGNGCGNGGDFIDGFNTIIQSDGILEESQYPYKEATQTCKKVNIDETEAYITCFKLLPPNDEQNLQRAVTTQPVAVGIAAGDEFGKYKGGVYSGPCAPLINHAVTLVGYGTTEEGLKYWLIKNSWGKDWGEGGYMRILREGDGTSGHCDIANDGAIPCIN